MHNNQSDGHEFACSRCSSTQWIDGVTNDEAGYIALFEHFAWDDAEPDGALLCPRCRPVDNNQHVGGK